MRLLEAIVAANHATLERRTGAPDPRTFTAALPLAALTCIDPRLNKFFPAMLGLQEEQFIWLRNAGNVITNPTSSTVRSVAMAVFLKGAKELAVIGHTDCIMSKISTNELLDRLAAAGISRGALPIPNLHEFFGLFSSERANVIKAVGFLRTSPVIPLGMPIHGLLLDTQTGRLEWVVNGYESSGLSLDTQGAPEGIGRVSGYSTGPVKSLGTNTTPLKAPEWKPAMPKIGGPPPAPPPPSPPPPPKPQPPPVPKQPPTGKVVGQVTYGPRPPQKR